MGEIIFIPMSGMQTEVNWKNAISKYIHKKKKKKNTIRIILRMGNLHKEQSLGSFARETQCRGWVKSTFSF